MFAKYIIFCVGFSLQYQWISTSDSCQTKITCQECISDPSICVWCAENDFNSTTRCMPQSSVEDSWCPMSEQNPKNVIQASEEKDFSSISEHIIQIKPQRYKLKVRQGMPQSFNFSFQGAQDYPVDLYFLLDASRTMENIKNMTAEQGQKIYLAIKEMTENVHLGFGTFIDKRMLPIMSNIHDPELTYSFRHRLKLVDDFKQFKEAVSKSPSGVSRDQQEGGLDALAQVLVCKDIIGWRNESRKIVVFLTDGPYHAAGDGKSAGLFEPYDGQCYTEKGTYTKELEMDYPSVGMINKLAAERDIIIIFLVDSTFAYIYEELKKVVSGSQVAKFSRNKQMKNDAIVTILKDIYENISNKIKLIAKVKSGSKKNIKISFNPDCTSDDNNPACDIENGKELNLVGTVQYDSAESAVVDIIVEGIREKLTLEIDTIKSCDCERDELIEINSIFCYGEKRFCGICSCSENRYGDRCGCVKSEKNGYKDNSTCIDDGSTDVCSRHGSCICGTCQCRERYKGKFCQCNVDSCPRSTWSSPESVCGGEEHGECDCGRCKCSADWSGDACDCYKPDTYCKEYNSSSVCNDRGQCVCGKCQCDQIAVWDARNSQTEKCQISPCTDCHERQCGKLENCAKCRHSGHEDCISCDDRIMVKVESLTEEHKNSSLWNLCSNVKVGIGCQTSFVYRYSDTDYSLELVVAEEKDCAPSYILFGGIFFVTLLLVGAGTLIAWKLLTDARDRHEYLKFMQQNEMDATGPCNNPLYASPSTTFNNPAFRKRSVDIR